MEKFHVEFKFCAVDRCCALLVHANESMGHPDRQEKIYDAEFRRKNGLCSVSKNRAIGAYTTDLFGAKFIRKGGFQVLMSSFDYTSTSYDDEESFREQNDRPCGVCGINDLFCICVGVCVDICCFFG